MKFILTSTKFRHPALRAGENTIKKHIHKKAHDKCRGQTVVELRKHGITTTGRNSYSIIHIHPDYTLLGLLFNILIYILDR